MKKKSVIAFFDFDGTITYGDTFRHFLRFSVGWPRFIFNMLTVSPYLLLYLLNIVSRQKVKEKVISRFYQKMLYCDLKVKADAFVDSELDQHLRPEALRRIAWHQKQGHRCILVSASPEVYLNIWAKNKGFSDILATRLALTKHGSILGEIKGKNCWGPEKVSRIEELLGSRKEFVFYAYGDSKGDKEMLSIADYPFYRHMPKD